MIAKEKKNSLFVGAKITWIEKPLESINYENKGVAK